MNEVKTEKEIVEPYLDIYEKPPAKGNELRRWLPVEQEVAFLKKMELSLINCIKTKSNPQAELLHIQLKIQRLEAEGEE